ncbi:NTF2 fold immunity protein [Mucilaginibacter pedocola]|uniref:NTF2 fold domain-containing protein n=1 Tax=Mucilaginibacter pedocola TaxID=1792845 RepID=A0A1S9P7B3_9SPHI|nr:NTF2 fold immunity protein [Mucilaginibacter pedocola]OOQ56829.1 hypothetical protein BC343_17770 [Mucilaginibacter pedocola]
MKKLLIACLLLFTGCDHTWQNLPLSTEDARTIIKYNLKYYRLPKRKFAPSALTDERSAVKAAEKVLFPIYGREVIRDEHPYTVGFADGYWVIYGYLPANAPGGVFSIVLYGETGEVLSIAHGK